jgi:hypothetical protein
MLGNFNMDEAQQKFLAAEVKAAAVRFGLLKTSKQAPSEAEKQQEEETEEVLQARFASLLASLPSNFHMLPAETLRQLLPISSNGKGNQLPYFLIFAGQQRLLLQEGQLLDLKQCAKTAQAATQEDDKLGPHPSQGQGGLAPARACATLHALRGLAVMPNTVPRGKQAEVMSRRNVLAGFRPKDGSQHRCEVWGRQLCDLMPAVQHLKGFPWQLTSRMLHQGEMQMNEAGVAALRYGADLFCAELAQGRILDRLEWTWPCQG